MMSVAVVYSVFVPLEHVIAIGGGRTLGLPLGVVVAAVWLWWRRGRFPGNRSLLGIAGLVAYFALSQFWAPSPGLYGVSATALGLVSAYILADVVRRVQGAAVAMASGLVAGVSVLATYSVRTHADLVALGIRLPGLDGQTTAHLAGVLALGIVCGIFVWVNASTRVVRYCCAVATGALVWPLILTQTRAAWLGVLLALLVVLFSGGRAGAPLSRMRKLSTGVVGVMVVGVGFGLGAEVIEDRIERGIETGGAGRTAIWTGGMKIFEGSPLIGVGYRAFPDAFTADVAQRVGDGRVGSGRAPHSIVVGVLVEGGAIGLALLLGAAWGLWSHGAGRGWPQTAPLVAVGIAVVTQSLFIDLLTRKYFWWGLAFLAVPGLPTGSEARSTTTPPSDRRTRVSDEVGGLNDRERMRLVRRLR